MKTQKITVILTLLILLSTAAAQAKEETPAISNTRTASCLVKVAADPAVLPLSFQTIDYLLHSSAVGGKAAREVLGISPDESHELFSIEPLSAGPAAVSPLLSPTAYQMQMQSYLEAIRPRVRAIQPQIQKENTVADKEEKPQDEKEQGDEKSFDISGESAAPKQVPPPAGYGGYAGGGSYGGGYGGGYGGYGAYGRGGYGAAKYPPLPPAYPPTAPQLLTSPADQTLLFRLQVDLDASIKPAAEEFMNAIIENSRQTLTDVSEAYKARLRDEVHFVEFRRDQVQAELSHAMGVSLTDADRNTQNQLEEIVDLSAFSREMPFGKAIEELKNAVEPLKIIVLWRDLEDNANIDQTAPISLDAISAIPLGKALELLLKSVSGGGEELAYQIEKGVITIATRETLPGGPKEILQTPEPQIPVRQLLKRKQELFRERQDLEMRIAVARARRDAIERQTSTITARMEDKLARDPVANELQEIVEIHTERFARLPGTSDATHQQALQQGKVITVSEQLAEIKAKAREKLVRVRIELAQRREELSKSVGGDRLAGFNRELEELTFELAEREARLDVISRQLGHTEQQLKAASAFDPHALQIRLAKEALETAQHRLNDLKAHLAVLQPPAVTVLGAD